MPVELVCPEKNQAFTIPTASWEQLEGRALRCPLCHASHEAIRAPGGAPKRGLTPLRSAALAGGVCVLALVVAFLVFNPFGSPFPGTRLEIGDDEVYFSGGATEEEARKLVEDLTEFKILGRPDGGSVHLEKTADGYAVSLIFGSRDLRDPEMASSVRILGAQLADRGLGRPLTMRMCDEDADVRSTHVIE